MRVSADHARERPGDTPVSRVTRASIDYRSGMTTLLRLLPCVLSLGCLVGLLASTHVEAAERVILEPLVHLRNVEPREWSSFPEQAESRHWEATFTSSDSFRPQTLRVRHRDVKQLWRVYLNDQEMGQLPRDENSMVTFYALPGDKLRDGDNTLRIASTDKAPDDVWIGDVRLIDTLRAEVLAQATIEVQVDEAGRGATPCRLTLVDDHGSLMTTGATSNDHLAVRSGVLYCSTGRARFTVPAGKYTLYAGRGFEYSLAQAPLQLAAGDTARPTLTITREVPTDGWVSCDPHVHTFTYSRHGDATIEERMITIAGEGIELPVATDHNLQIDFEPFARQLNVRRFFTPLVGNEVTTKVGHFNVFPLDPSASVIDHKGLDWQAVVTALQAAPADKIVILNHARDVHNAFRPFDPRRHVSFVGEDLEGWQLPANAMEVVNSGTTNQDPLLLYHDWLGLLNRGLSITPCGTSDSHDVARHFVGQGRTYIRVDDRDVSNIDRAAACRSFREGRVMAGLGLMCRATINEQFGSGDLAKHADAYRLNIDVLGPSWVSCDRVRIYINGVLNEEISVSRSHRRSDQPIGVRWRGERLLPKLAHDAHVVVIATGKGVDGLFWPVAKSYQPVSPEWKSYVVGCCGAIRMDGDGDGAYRSPYAYAQQLVESAGGDVAKLFDSLAKYDEAVAAEAASILLSEQKIDFATLSQAATRGTEPVKRGVFRYLQARKDAASANP